MDKKQNQMFQIRSLNFNLASNMSSKERKFKSFNAPKPEKEEKRDEAF